MGKSGSPPPGPRINADRRCGVHQAEEAGVLMAVNNRARNGKIGELLVELELVKKGWHVQRLDGASMAPNGDLIVVNQSNI